MQQSEHHDLGAFKLLQSFDIEYAPVKVSKWRSENTGLTVVVGSHKNPITNGYFTVASEIFDDTGRPHTLEHLIFLGSDKFPYKGVLDQLANRAGSNGTNAWTAEDHTAYTISTAGSQGFLEMLPIFVDHVLHPTLTDAGFVTEVHHINGKGEDAGVVYSEMQARENQSWDLIALRTQRTLYPKTSAYRSETGGLMSMLRQLTAQQIRDYHAQYYIPKNLCLIIDGAVPIPELFQILNNKVEPMISAQLAKRQSVAENGWKRPFVETTTSQPISISKDITEVVEFMEEDESMGEIYLNFLGPSPLDQFTNLALKLLGLYLSDTVTSPLQKEFVDITKPYCSGISLTSEDRVNHNELCFYVSDVPAKHLETFAGMLRGKLRKIVEGKEIDLTRMERVLRRDQRKLLNLMESNVTGVLSDAIIADFLYGDFHGKDLPSAFNVLADYKDLTSWNAQSWVDLISRYFLDGHCITMIAKPSASLSAKLEKEERDRIERRRADLGEEELKRLEEAVKKAKAESDKPPPDGMVEAFPLTDPKSITWIQCETAISNVPGQTIHADHGDLQKRLDSEKIELPYQTHFSQVASNFVTISILLDTISLPVRLKPYVSLFTAALFSLGVKRADGTELSYEAVVDALNDLTVSHGASFTFRGNFSEVVLIHAKVAKADCEKALSWLRDLMSGCVFTPERLVIVVAKLLQELPVEKRSGDTVARVYANRLAFDKEKSASEAGSLLPSFSFLPAVAAELKDSPENVIEALEEVRKHLLDTSIMRVAIGGDVAAIQDVKHVLARSFLNIESDSPLSTISTSSQTLTELGKQPNSKLSLIPMPAIEGSYSVHLAKGPLGWNHPDAAASLLAVAVLNALESYLWKVVRGSGLAYGCHVGVDLEDGLSELVVYRSPNAHKAYVAAAGVIKGVADGSVSMDQATIDGARATLVYRYAGKSSTPSSAASTAYLNEALRQTGKEADREMLIALQSVTVDQVRDAITKYFLPLFDQSTAMGAVSVNKGLTGEVSAGFEALGFEVELQELPNLEGGEDDDDDEGEDDEDDDMSDEKES